MLLRQVPAARPDEQGRELLAERVRLARVRILERDGAPDRVAQIELALDHVGPARRARVLEVGHVDVRARVERIDNHFAIDRAGDLDPAVEQVPG